MKLLVCVAEVNEIYLVSVVPAERSVIQVHKRNPENVIYAIIIKQLKNAYCGLKLDCFDWIVGLIFS